MGEEPRIIELKTIQDTFATKVAKVEILGSCARFWVCVEQDSLGLGERDMVVVAKLVMPIECVPAAIQASSDGIMVPGPHYAVARELMTRRGSAH